MARVTIFNVQGYERIKGKLKQGRLRQFKKEAEALQVGGALSGKIDGVVIYSVEGDPEFDDWSEPKLIEAYGDVPDTDL